MSDFYEQVYEVTRAIPEGMVTSYGRIAQMLMKHRGARAVGYALRALRHKQDMREYADIPWHRVVNQHGIIRVGDLGEKTSLQTELLRAEGVKVMWLGEQYCVDMKAHLWEGLSLLDVEALFLDWEDR